MKKDEGLLYCHTTPATYINPDILLFCRLYEIMEKVLDSEAQEAKVAAAAAT